MSRRTLAVLLLGACGGPAQPPPRPPPAEVAEPAAPRPPPPCISVPEAAAEVTHASGDANRLSWCVGPTTTQCFRWDLTAGALERLDAPPPETAPTGARIETRDPELKVCTGDACTALTTTLLPGIAALHATTNTEGTIAVVLLGNAIKGKGYAEIWDIAKTKRIATFKYGRGEFRCGEVAMAGTAIYVSAATCGAPAARGALYSIKGRKIANVGGKDFGTYGNAFVQVEGNTFGFLEENGNKLVIQDVTRGKVIKRIDVSPLWTIDGAKNKDAMGNPGESAIVRLGDGKLAVIAGAPATGKIATIDVPTGTVEISHAPVCERR